MSYALDEIHETVLDLKQAHRGSAEDAQCVSGELLALSDTEVAAAKDRDFWPIWRRVRILCRYVQEYGLAEPVWEDVKEKLSY